ncbi:hypothetical protein PIB30_007243 [Stylosanthes scabra]|uniref:Pentatricopeptide repeat-containing protein n=1 Tax=Stylosanthes scabra TaxID=79078 RepID=A0ABU6V603_9FABA|nr:hypothetical protein [Stylosanthes scabra]
MSLPRHRAAVICLGSLCRFLCKRAEDGDPALTEDLWSKLISKPFNPAVSISNPVAVQTNRWHSHQHMEWSLGSCSTLRSLTQLHAHLVVTGFQNDPLPSTKLIESYSQMGSLPSSRLVFDTHPSPDSFMLGVLIKCYLWNHLFHQVVSLYHNHIHMGSFVFVYPSVLRAVTGVGDLVTGRKVHGTVIKSGHESDAVIGTSLLGMYGELCCLVDAQKLFDEMPDRDLVSWSSVISCYVENGRHREGLEMFCQMILEQIRPDKITLLSVAKGCARVGCLKLLKSIHGYAIRSDMVGDASLSNALIIMYGQCGHLRRAEGLFEFLTDRSTACWTSMVSSYNRNGCFREALESFIQMQESRVEPNAVTMINALYSCARLCWLKEGKSVHCFILRKAMDAGNLDLGPALMEFYAACWELSSCHKLLYITGNINIVSWNTLISFYAREGLHYDAMVLFANMLTKGLMSDSYSLARSISASAGIGSIQFGKQLHGHAMKRGFLDEFVQNSLIDMYLKCGFVDLAYLVFDKIAQKSIVTWNCMISGLSQNGFSVAALKLFDQMYFNCLEIDEVTLLCGIQACSNLGYLEEGKWIHHKIIVSGVQSNLYINTALVDMYAKSGDLQTAKRVFDIMQEKSVVSWSAMIAAYGVHGQMIDAASLFTEMVESGIKPNEVTFMNILSACRHTGSMEAGKFYFNSMRDYGIEPNIEHFASIVDLLSRAGDLDGSGEDEDGRDGTKEEFVLSWVPSYVLRYRDFKAKAGWLFGRGEQELDASAEHSESSNEDILLFFFQLDLATRVQLRNKLTEVSGMFGFHFACYKMRPDLRFLMEGENWSEASSEGSGEVGGFTVDANLGHKDGK